MEIGWVNTPQDWRDVFIMSFMVAGTLLFLVGILFTVIIGLLTAATLNRARGILRSNLQPALENVRETTESVRGTVAFISDYAVSPVVRAYSTYSGARRFIVVFMRFARPKRGK
jgi:hypothetical protein